MFNSQSKMPIISTAIYGVISLMAFVLLFANIDTDNMSGIFVVLVAMPWTIIFAPLIESFGIESMILNALFMAVGVIINALLIYIFFSFITRKK